MTKAPQEQQPKPHVCRRLFPDEEEDEPREIGENRENRFVEDLHNQPIEDFIARYNFDPRTERPLPGNYEWYERRNSDGVWERMRLPGEQREPPARDERETEDGVKENTMGAVLRGVEAGEEEGVSQ